MKNYILKEKIPVAADNEKEFFSFMEKNKVISRDTIGESMISTVFLGFDHGFGGTPLLFETMIFGGAHDGYQKRYTTYEEAEEGHEESVYLVSKIQVDRETRLSELGI